MDVETPVEYCRRMLTLAEQHGDTAAAAHYRELLRFWERQP